MDGMGLKLSIVGAMTAATLLSRFLPFLISVSILTSG